MRISMRALWIGFAALACVLGAAAAVHRRSEAFRRLAAYHEQAASVLILEKVGEVCTDGLGPEENVGKIIAGRGNEVLLAYRAVQYHERLAEKYAGAAGRPWRWVEADPQPPPGAFPTFDFDPDAKSSDDSGADFR